MDWNRIPRLSAAFFLPVTDLRGAYDCLQRAFRLPRRTDGRKVAGMGGASMELWDAEGGDVNRINMNITA